LAGEEGSAASCEKRAKQKPKHRIAESTFFIGGGAAMFLGLWPGYRQSGWRLLLGGFLVMSWMDHFCFPCVATIGFQNASGSSRRIEYARCVDRMSAIAAIVTETVTVTNRR
jgi:hypothetical protein